MNTLKNILIILFLFVLSQKYSFSQKIIIQVIDSSYISNSAGKKIYCKDDYNCILSYFNIGDKNTKLSCIRFLKSSDGGETWFCASIDCPAWEYDSSIEAYKYNVRSIPLNFIYTDYEELIGGFSNGQIARSKDYGKTWVKERDTIFDYFETEGLSIIFLDGKRALGYTNQIPIGKGSGYGRIFISDTNYRNWKNIPVPDSLNIFMIHSIYNFYNKFYILHGSFQNKFYYFSKTEDFGINWSIFKFPIKLIEPRGAKMFFLNDSTGWVTLNYKDSTDYKISVFFTKDNGNNWELISEMNSYYKPKSLLFFNNEEGIILEESKAFITKDGGRSWNILTYNGKDSIAPYTIYSYFIMKKNEFLCITNEGIIFKLIITDF